MTTAKTAKPEVDSRRGRDVESIKLGFTNHLKYVLAKDQYSATRHDRYLALALTIRDRLIERWIRTQQTHHKRRVKRVYFLSLEYLLGRSISNNVINLGMLDATRRALDELGLRWEELRDQEVDAGLGNGGLGRLAACLLDSLATMEIPAVGYGLRYDYGIFRQRIDNGYQVEQPDDWLRLGNPWETRRPANLFAVQYGGRTVMTDEDGRLAVRWLDARPVIGVPYDIPITGYGGSTVNTLRLWSAHAAEEFDFEDFNRGDYIAAVASKVTAENLTKVLYPNDNVYQGKELRLRQQYFFVSCSLQDILRRFKNDHDDWNNLPNRAAIQINDTHPSLAILELMRQLVDLEDLGWEQAWDICVRCFGYTNHTLLSEALEQWPAAMFERILPRHLEICYEINRRLLAEVAARHPGDTDRIRRMSLFDEGPPKQLRMANLCIVGSHSTNGVARLHSELLKRRVFPEFAEMYPDRFSNKTNGVTPRRWLLAANPPLARLITEAIGDRWITDLGELRRLLPLADDADFRRRFREAKRQAKQRLAAGDGASRPLDVDIDTIFDVQVKRIHEYKRQVLNVLHIVSLYRRLREDAAFDVAPRTFIFGGKAAPGYARAKLSIKLINNVAAAIDSDPAVRGRLKVVFVPDYRVSLAEAVIPAADVSEQISQAGTEASGTGNMKFMLNGALTVGTLDGANIEIHEEVGDENIFIFGLTSAEVAKLAPHYQPRQYYERDDELRATLDFLFSGHFDRGEGDLFDPLRHELLDDGDRYMNLADFHGYCAAQRRVDAAYRDCEAWSRAAIINIACSGRFSSDRTVADYLRDVWHVEACSISVDDDEAAV